MRSHALRTLTWGAAYPPTCGGLQRCRGAQAFKSYDEAGAVRRIQCLKYLVLATMLMESAVDPFDAQARRAAPATSSSGDIDSPNVDLPASGGRAASAWPAARVHTATQERRTLFGECSCMSPRAGRLPGTGGNQGRGLSRACARTLDYLRRNKKPV